jgi:hypothetical protein
MYQAPVRDDLDPGYIANVISVRAESFYVDALRLAETSEPLLEVLGAPLRAELPRGGINYLRQGTPVERDVAKMLLEITLRAMGRVDTSPDIEKFGHVSIVLRGPKAEGNLIVLAFGDDGEWTFQAVVVEIEGRAERIELW